MAISWASTITSGVTLVKDAPGHWDEIKTYLNTERARRIRTSLPAINITVDTTGPRAADVNTIRGGISFASSSINSFTQTITKDVTLIKKVDVDEMRAKVQTLTDQPFANSSTDCAAGCAGVCVGCDDTCFNLCQGCGDACSYNCDGCSGCGTACSDGCTGCGSGCANGCSGCGDACSYNCTGCSGCGGCDYSCSNCGGVCSDGCTGCGSGCATGCTGCGAQCAYNCSGGSYF